MKSFLVGTKGPLYPSRNSVDLLFGNMHQCASFVVVAKQVIYKRRRIFISS